MNEAKTKTGNGHNSMKYCSRIAYLVIFLIAIMLILTKGNLNRALWVALWVGVAITSGIIFSVFTTDSTGQIDFKQLGIKLGGGAAIGAAFMLLPWWMTKPDINYTIIPVPSEIHGPINIENLTTNNISDVGELRTVGRKRYLFVDFFDEEEEGKLLLKYSKSNSAEILVNSYFVTIKGKLEKVQNDGGQ